MVDNGAGMHHFLLSQKFASINVWTYSLYQMKRKEKNDMRKRTAWETENRSFLSDLELGKKGEKRIISFLEKHKNVEKVVDISDTEIGKRDDIDLEVHYTDGHISTVEIKTDTKAHITGNIAYEERSHRNPGCFARTKADHIFYLLQKTGQAYVLNPNEFRKFIAEMKNDKESAKQFGIRPVSMGEGAFGYLVPIKNLVSTNVVECEMHVA